MYTDFYNLTSKPFQISSDPAFIWLGEKHKEALAALKYGILDNKGFMLLTGDVGTGKTTLINTLINSLDDDVLYASVPDPRLNLNDFFNYIAQALNIEGEFESKGKFLTHFRRFLEDAYDRKKKVLLLIDESQLLTQDLLEETRLLSNIQKDGINLLNIFFVGQDEFNETLSRTENRAVAQRLAFNYHLVPLTEQETKTYIIHRLKIAGAKENLFDGSAMAEVHSYSGGFPRRINIICDHCLLAGFVQKKKIIDRAMVQESAYDLKIPQYFKQTPPPPSTPPLEQELEEFLWEVEQENRAPKEPSPLPPVREKSSSSWGSARILLALLGGLILFFTFPQEKLISVMEQVTGGKVSAEKTDNLQTEVEKPIAAGDDSSATEVQTTGSSVMVEVLPIQESNTAGEPERLVVEEKMVEETAAAVPEIIDEPVEPEKQSEIPAAPATVVVPEKEPVTQPEAEEKALSPEHPAAMEEPGGAGSGKTEKALGVKGEDTDVPVSPPIKVTGTEPDKKTVVYEFPDEKVIVRFEHDSSDFYFTELDNIDTFVKAIKSHPNAVLVISGHTDSQGSEPYNHRLSLFRANMVRSFFLGRGVQTYQLKVQGFGSTKPLASNDTVKGRKLNRRVEIDILR